MRCSSFFDESLVGSGVYEQHAEGQMLSVGTDKISCRVDVAINEDLTVRVRRYPNAVMKVLRQSGSLPSRLSGWDSYEECYSQALLSDGAKVFLKNGMGNGIVGVEIRNVGKTSEGVLSFDYNYQIYPLQALALEEKRTIADGIVFRTKARLLNQLGEQLIKNEGVALLELIKNAYDADASQCRISMIAPRDLKNGEICIADDGCGMDLDTIRRAWLAIGTDSKASAGSNPRTRTLKYHRMPLGEKGIGRFGVHRLGQVVDVVTKTASSPKEVHLRIDWRKLNDSEYVEDIPVECWERDPVLFRDGATGTRIVISAFRAAWTKRSVVEAARAITALNSPFEGEGSFRTSLSIECDEQASKWASGVVQYEDIKDLSLFEFDILMNGNRITSYHYGFKPWSTLVRLNPRHVDWNETSPLSRMVCFRDGLELWDGVSSHDFENDWAIDISNLGEVRFKGVIFDLDSKILSLGVQDRRGLKAYLKANSGIRVFRDNMRVLNYGEPGDDWLGLNDRKMRRSTAHVGGGVILGAVYLDRATSSALVEKSNREGFIDNDAFRRLRAAVNFCLDRIDADWETDKNLLRKTYAPRGVGSDVPVQTPVAELRELINKSRSIGEDDRRGVLQCINRIESDFAMVVDNLIKSAGAGLNLIMVLHQMDKIVSSVNRSVKRNASAESIVGQLKMLEDLIRGYSVMVKSSERKLRALPPIVSQAVFNAKFRFEAHQIQLETPYLEKKVSSGVCCEGHVLNAILNVFDNSIWWLGYARTDHPAIFVDISEKLDGYVSVVIADNGPGFTKPTSEIVRPFVTDKPGGMGIGLHLTDEIMKSLGGKLVFPKPDLFDLPPRYYKGAIVALAFSREAGK